MLHEEGLSPKQLEELGNFDEIETAGYRLAASSHETAKDNEGSAKDIWSKEGRLFIGNSLEELRPFNGEVKTIMANGTNLGNAVIDHDNEEYSLRNVMRDIAEYFDSDDFELVDAGEHPQA